MTLKKANRIKELVLGEPRHSWRRIAEIIEEEFPEYPELSGNQLHGYDLVLEAMELLYNKPINKISRKIRYMWDR